MEKPYMKVNVQPVMVLMEINDQDFMINYQKFMNLLIFNK